MTCCKKSFNLCDPIPSCLTQLIVKTPVISDDVTLRFFDKFNKVYYVPKTSDAQGKVTIQLIEDASDPLNILTIDLPAALLNEYAGVFYLFLLDANNNQVKWTISAVDYDALGFKCVNITPVLDTYTLDPTYLPGEEGDFSGDFNFSS